MRILFVVPYAPNQIRTRPYNLIKALVEKGHQVILATLWTDQQELDELSRVVGNEKRIVAERMTVSGSLWNCSRTLFSTAPLQASYSWKPVLASRLAQILEASDIDVVHVEHLRGSRYALYLRQFLSEHRRKIPVVWDSVDCISHLFAQAGRESCSLRSRLMARLELSRTRVYEGWLVPRFDRVLVTSFSDRTHLLDLAFQQNGNGMEVRTEIQRRVKVLPNGVDLDYFSPSFQQREPSTLVITGKMSYHANVAAVVSFVREVMPQVWAKRPDVRVWIVGKDPTREVRSLGSQWFEGQRPCQGADKRILVTGTVQDIRPFLRQATIAVAPIQYGAGIQNKVLEALACGTCVVCTPEAISGISVRHGQDLLVGEGSRSMAAAIVSVLEDPEKRNSLQQAGRGFVERNHNWGSIVGQLTSVYEEARTELRDHTCTYG